MDVAILLDGHGSWPNSQCDQGVKHNKLIGQDLGPGPGQWVKVQVTLWCHPLDHETLLQLSYAD